MNVKWEITPTEMIVMEILDFFADLLDLCCEAPSLPAFLSAHRLKVSVWSTSWILNAGLTNLNSRA